LTEKRAACFLGQVERRKLSRMQPVGGEQEGGSEGPGGQGQNWSLYK
jgi:hypothetical protein